MSASGISSLRGVTRLQVLVPVLAAPVIAGLAVTGSFVAACMLFAVAVALPRASGRAIDVRVLIWALAGIAFLLPDRYTIAASLPIDLEPYRIVFGCVTLVWVVALLTHPEARFRRTIVDIPLFLVLASMLISEVANPERANRFGESVVKALLLFATYILMVYLVCSAFSSLADTRRLVSVVVGFGTIVAAFAIVESATRYNVFDEWLRLGAFTTIPNAYLGGEGRGSATRALASASHPIALGVVLAMLLPLAAYLAHRDRRWLVSVVLLPAGTFATVSRTPLLMLVVSMLVLGSIRPAQSLRLVAVVALAAGALLVASPSSLDAVVEAFFPKGGLLAQQSNTLTGNVESRGRLADLDPVLREWASEPFFGQGFGSRPVDGRENSLGDGRYSGVLDNQWLDLLLETGSVGVLGWMALFVVLIKRLLRHARIPDDAGMLCLALLASLVSCFVAMFFLDAFGFPQLTFVTFLMIAIAANLIRQADELHGSRRVSPTLAEA